MTTIIGDVTALHQRHHPLIKGKIVSKYCNITKNLGRGPINNPPPPPSLYHGGGMSFTRTSEG